MAVVLMVVVMVVWHFVACLWQLLLVHKYEPILCINNAIMCAYYTLHLCAMELMGLNNLHISKTS